MFYIHKDQPTKLNNNVYIVLFDTGLFVMEQSSYELEISNYVISITAKITSLPLFNRKFKLKFLYHMVLVGYSDIMVYRKPNLNLRCDDSNISFDGY